MTIFESSSRFSLLLEHAVFRKPVPIPHQVRDRLFRHHALDKPSYVHDGAPIQAAMSASDAVDGSSTGT
jgi:hypothetical protein